MITGHLQIDDKGIAIPPEGTDRPLDKYLMKLYVLQLNHKNLIDLETDMPTAEKIYTEVCRCLTGNAKLDG